MAAVTDSESSYPHTCSVLHSSASSSHSCMFLSPGQTLPVTPAVSPLSPLHYENVLVSPIPVSLMPSSSQVLDKVGPTSPQHQLTAALQQNVRPEAYSHPALISSQSTNPLHTHTVSSQNTHAPTNGSTQTFTKVTMEAATVECRYLAKGCKYNISLIAFNVYHKKIIFELRISIHMC